MKIGMIFECGKGHADQQVCEHLVRMLDLSINIESIPLDCKTTLIQNWVVI